MLPEFQETTNFLLTLAEKAGKILLKYYSPAGVSFSKKEDLSRVTEADFKVNRMVIEEVEKNYPDFRVQGEEESNDIADSKKLFVVDPLDGTLMFTIGSPLFCFSAAIVLDGKSVAGVIYNPLAKRTLLAEINKGTWLIEENKKMSVSQKSDFDFAMINCGFRETEFSSLLQNLGARTPAVYAACEYASLVATGGFDGGLYLSDHAYDIAAAKIIIEEAGGKVTDIYGEEQRYDKPLRGALMSNGILHNNLLKLIEQGDLREKLNTIKL